MKISYSAIWEDTVRLIRTHASLAAALAGVFLFLPALLVGHFLPMPQATEAQEMIRQLGEYLRGNFHWLLLSTILSMAGTLAILFLVFRGTTTSVGAAITGAFALFPSYVGAVILSLIPIAIAAFIVGIIAPAVAPAIVALLVLFLLLMLIPVLYALAGRLLPLGALIVAEGERNPVNALGRTWRLTKGCGWKIVGLFILVSIPGLILAGVVGGIIGLILRLALPEDLAGFLGLIVSTATSTALHVVLIFLYAAIYRSLSGRPAVATGTASASADLGAVPPADGPR